MAIPDLLASRQGRLHAAVRPGLSRGARTTLRGGYGIFFDTVGVNKTSGLQAGFSQATPIQASLEQRPDFVATKANPFPSGLLEPRGAAGGLRPTSGSR